MYMRLEFHDEGGKTRLVLRQGPYPRSSADMAREGWGSSSHQARHAARGLSPSTTVAGPSTARGRPPSSGSLRR